MVMMIRNLTDSQQLILTNLPTLHGYHLLVYQYKNSAKKLSMNWPNYILLRTWGSFTIVHLLTNQSSPPFSALHIQLRGYGSTWLYPSSSLNIYGHVVELSLSCRFGCKESESINCTFYPFRHELYCYYYHTNYIPRWVAKERDRVCVWGQIKEKQADSPQTN